MTRVHAPSVLDEKSSEVAITSDLPSHSPTTTEGRPSIEKQSTPCSHTALPTPHLDAYVMRPQTREHLRALSTDLAHAADGDHCWRCAMESAARTMASAMRDMRTAKKSGQFSAEEKKAVKAEAKELMKGMKKDMKEMKRSWKEEKKMGRNR